MRCVYPARKRMICRPRSSSCASRSPTFPCNFRISGTDPGAASGFQPADPAPVQPVGYPVERTHARFEFLDDLLRCLHRGARPRDQLLAPVLAPGADELGCHFDVALHAEVLAQRERLVGAVGTGSQARRPGGNAEGLAMPMEP